MGVGSSTTNPNRRSSFSFPWKSSPPSGADDRKNASCRRRWCSKSCLTGGALFSHATSTSKCSSRSWTADGECATDGNGCAEGVEDEVAGSSLAVFLGRGFFRLMASHGEEGRKKVSDQMAVQEILT